MATRKKTQTKKKTTKRSASKKSAKKPAKKSPKKSPRKSPRKSPKKSPKKSPNRAAKKAASKSPSKSPSKQPARTSTSPRSPASPAPRPPAAAARAPSSTPLRERRPQPSRAPTPPDSLALPPPEWLAIEGAGPEKRRYERVRQELPVRLYAGKAKDSYLEASLRTVDVSLSGMFLRSTFFLPEDIPVRVEVDAPWDTTAVVHGRIARVDRDGVEPGFAIEFDSLDPESLKDLVCLFAGEHVERFVRGFLPGQKNREPQTLLWEGIVAWELARLSLKVEKKQR